MADISGPVADGQRLAREAIQEAGPFIQVAARIGYASRGAVYTLVGLLAAMAAIGAGGMITDSGGALQTIVRQPFGVILLGCVAAGFAGFSLWQFIRAIEDPEHAGTDLKGIAKRLGYFCSGCIYVALMISAIKIIIGTSRQFSSDNQAADWSAELMSYPFGRWLVAAVGTGVVIYGISRLYRAYKAKLGERLQVHDLGAKARKAILAIGRLGIGARGIVFGLVGAFLLMAAWYRDPSEARGLSGALRFVENQPYGPWLLAIVALGLVAYGLYQFIEARYRRIQPHG